MRYDIIILGGGIIGCALAEELARRTQRVLVIERGRVGAEASSAAAGILAAQMDLPRPGPLFDLCQASRRLYPRWIKHLERRSGLRLGFRRSGIVYLVMSQRDAQVMARRARWQRRRGLSVERWSRRDLARREPSVQAPSRGAYYFPHEAQLDNVKLMAALARACRRAGIVVHERTTLRRLVIRKRRVVGVVTSRGMVHAPVVVNCLGSWAAMGGRFPVRVPVRPVRGQMLAFRGPRRLFRHVVMSPRAYVVQRADGRLLVGSTMEFAGFTKALTLDGIRGILGGVHRFTDQLSLCTFEDAWAGFRPHVADGLPILGATSIKGLHVATGHFRHGILLAPVTAVLMTELILQGRASLDLAPFSPTRF